MEQVVDSSALLRQLGAVIRALDWTERLLARSTGDRALLEADLKAYRVRLAKLDRALWKTPVYPCHCGRRLSECPNRLGSICCNLLDKQNPETRKVA